MRTIIKQCLNCGKDFKTLVKEVKRGNGKFCSLKCSSRFIWKNQPIKLANGICSYCGKHFFRSPSKLSQSKYGLTFCSRNCKDSAQRIGGLKPLQKYNKKYCSQYRIVALRELPNQCNRCGYSEHPQILVVHHKDHNRKNNTISNLEILCPNCHACEHYLQNITS